MYERKLYVRLNAHNENLRTHTTLLRKDSLWKTPIFISQILVTHIRPLIDFGSVLWKTDGHIGDLHLLQSVQRHWTKKIESFADLSYAERLSNFNLFFNQPLQYWDVFSYSFCLSSVNFIQPHLFIHLPIILYLILQYISEIVCPSSLYLCYPLILLFSMTQIYRKRIL